MAIRLKSVESILDAPAQLVEAVVEAERLFPVAFVGNDRLATTLMELAAQFGAVVRFASSQHMAIRRPLTSASA